MSYLKHHVKRLVPYIIVLAGFGLLYVSNRYLAGYTQGVRAETVKITNISQILPLTNRYVRPLLYTHVGGLATLPTDKAKQTFISAVLPAVLVARHELVMLKTQLVRLGESRRWSHADSVMYQATAQRFRAHSLPELLAKIGTLPNSIVLAQAAVESGWGQSRIFLEGNNLFGIWSFDPKEPRLAAGNTRGKRVIWLRSYSNMSESIISYFEILSTAHAFKGLREARAGTADPFVLLPYLKNFSERRSAYTRQLKSMIRQNDLTRFDDYELDPEYLFEK